MKLSLFIICALFSLLNAAINVSFVESEASKSLNLLIQQELKLATAALNCIMTARSASSNLKDSKLTKDFSTSVLNFINLTNDVQFVKNFEKITFCSDSTVCQCISIRSFFAAFQIMKIERMIRKSTENSTIHYQSLMEIVKNFQKNFKPLQFAWTKEFLMLTLFNRSSAVLTEFWKYFGVLSTSRLFSVNLNNFLNLEKTLNNCSSLSTSFASDGSKIDDNLKQEETKILNLTFIATEKIKNALNSVVAKKVGSSADIKIALQKLFITFEKTDDANDYSPDLKWPQIPDTDGASYKKFKVYSSKKEQYSFSFEDSKKNKSEIEKNLNELINSSLSVTSSKKVSASGVVGEAINATWNVINQFTVYSNALDAAINKVSQIQQSLMIGMCSAVQDVFTANGYYKTVCKISNLTNFATAQESCQSIGMKLCQVVNIDDYTGLIQAAFGFNAIGGVSFFNIDGTQASNGAWMVGNQKLFSAAIPTVMISGRCLNVYQVATKFTFRAVNCSLTTWNSYCEFKKITAPTNPGPKNCLNPTSCRTPSGKYLKNVCYLDNLMDNSVAQAACLNKPYVVRTADDLNALKTAITKYSTAPIVFFISGLKDAAGIWKVGPEGSPLFSDGIPAVSTGSCLVYVGGILQGRPCNEPNRVLCEYIVDENLDQLDLNPIGSCGTFLEFDSLNYTSNPAINGFSSGVSYKDVTWGSPQFVGFGNSNSCITDMTLSPGYISTFPSYTGVWMPCSGVEKNDKISAYYLTYHPDLIWVAANASNLRSIDGQITHNYDMYQLRYGRILVNGFYLLGRLNYATGILSYTDKTTYKEVNSSYEVLICKTQPPCGTFEPFDITNSEIISKGVLGGFFTNKEPVYVGYGDNSACQGLSKCPARLMVTQPLPGGYFSCTGTVIYNTTGLFYLRDHPNLLWIPTSPNFMNTISTAISVSSGGKTFYFGRFINTGISYLGKIEKENNNSFYFPKIVDQVFIDSGYEVLTCAKNPPVYDISNIQSVCFYVRPVINENGTYVKSLCKFGQTIDDNYITANNNCRNYKMELFSIVTAEDHVAANAFGSRFPRPVIFRINGQFNSTDGNWYVKNPTMKPLFSEAIPANRTAGNNCLVLKSTLYGFSILDADCTTEYQYFCEYV